MFDRKLDAERWLMVVEHQKLTGGYVDPSAGKVTFKSCAEEWRVIQPVSPQTAALAEQQLRGHVYPVLGDRPLGAIRPTEREALVRRMSDGLAASTLEVVYGAWRPSS